MILFHILQIRCAALRHLSSKYDKTSKWYPAGEADRARVNEYLDWQHSNTRKHGVGIYFNKVRTSDKSLVILLLQN